MKICFIHPWVKDIPSFLKHTCLEGKVNSESLVWDEVSPDLLIASEWIYYKKDFFHKFQNLYSKSGLKAAYLSEAIEADWNIFDYGIGFSDRYGLSDRFIRLLSPGDMYVNFIPYVKNEISCIEEAQNVLKEKTGFCNFLYSNAKAHPMRDNLFHQISRYKRVDSLGRHLNNVNIPGTGYGNGHSMDCIGLKAPYKFSIASENAVFSGYTSEKCYTSLLAHSVPIYWGNPNIKDDVNPDAIINIPDYETIDDAIDRIREVDTHDEIWVKMVLSPWRTPEQVEAQTLRTENYFMGMNNILSGKLPSVIPHGYHPDMYKEHSILRTFPKDDIILDKLLRWVRMK